MADKHSANTTIEGSKTVRDPNRSINRPISGKQSAAVIVIIIRHELISARDQPNSLVSGFMKTPSELMINGAGPAEIPIMETATTHHPKKIRFDVNLCFAIPYCSSPKRHDGGKRNSRAIDGATGRFPVPHIA